MFNDWGPRDSVSAASVPAKRERVRQDKGMRRMHRREFLKSAASCLGALGFAQGSWCALVSGIDAGDSGVYLNQMGFLPGSPKVATIRVPASSFLIRSLKDNSVAFRSPLGAQRLDSASGDTVRLADFSP